MTVDYHFTQPYNLFTSLAKVRSTCCGIKVSFLPWNDVISNLWPDLTCAVWSLCLMSIFCVFSLSSLSWSQAKVDNEIIDYRDLAAIPRVKAIYDIEHPDMISYKSVNDNSSALDNKGNTQDRQNPAEVTSSNAPSLIHWHVCVIFCWWVCFALVWLMRQTK